jgi:hypothetical protein
MLDDPWVPLGALPLASEVAGWHGGRGAAVDQGEGRDGGGGGGGGGGGVADEEGRADRPWH